MARQFLRLRLRVLANSLLRGSSQQRVLSALGLVLGFVAGVVGGLLLLATRGNTDASDSTLVFIGVFAIGWLILPLLLFGSDNTIDPVRFSLLPLTSGQLVRGQLLAGIVGASGAFGVLTLGAAAYAVSDSPGSLLLAGLAAALTLAICMIASRALTTSIGGLLRSRRGRDLALVVAGALAASIYPLQVVAQQFFLDRGDIATESIARVVAWTPFGWPFAAVRDGVDGVWGGALLRLAGTGVVIAGLLAVWARAVTKTLEAPEASGGSGRSGAGALAPRWARAVLPRGQVGAVAAKELRYWWRDPRRRVAILTSVLVGIGIVAGPALTDNDGVGSTLAFAGLSVAFFSTMNTSNQLGLDGSALWIDVAVPGVAGQLVRGRQTALALLIAPVILVVTITGTILAGVPLATGAGALGASLAALGCGLATTSVMCVLAPYAVPENPSNPFAGSSGAGLSTLAYQIAGLVSQLVLLAPVGVLLIWGLAADAPSLLWIDLVLGPVWGLGLALAGGHLAGRRLEVRGPDVLAAVRPRGT